MPLYDRLNAMEVFDGAEEMLDLYGADDPPIPLELLQPLLLESAVDMAKMASDARSLLVGNQLQAWWEDDELLVLHATGPIGKVMNLSCLRDS